MSAPFSLVLSLELRASGLWRRKADKAASGRGRCGALQGRAALRFPQPPQAPPRRDVSARRAAWGRRSGLRTPQWPALAGLSRLGDGHGRLGLRTRFRVECSRDPSTPSQDRGPQIPAILAVAWMTQERPAERKVEGMERVRCGESNCLAT